MTALVPLVRPGRCGPTRAGNIFHRARRAEVAQKGAGGNPGAVTKKGGDGASGSTGTGRGGGKKGNAGGKG